MISQMRVWDAETSDLLRRWRLKPLAELFKYAEMRHVPSKGSGVNTRGSNRSLPHDVSVTAEGIRPERPRSIVREAADALIRINLLA